MTTSETVPAPFSPTAPPPDGDQRVDFHGITWEGYEVVDRLRGERSRPKMVYLDGSLALVSPSYTHEYDKKRFAEFIHELIAGLQIPCFPSGETTFRREAEEAGAEPDESYYLASAARIRGKRKTLNLRDDPPPDLVIEVVHTHDPSNAVEVYRRLGVPEVWVWERGGLRILLLEANSSYAESETSRSFPFLSASEVVGWITHLEADTETAWIIKVRRWVATTLAPRLGHPPDGPAATE